MNALAAHMAEQPTGVEGMLFASGPRILNRYHLGKAFRRAARETLDTYSHLWPGFEDLTRAAVDSVLGAAADSLRTDSHGS